MTTFLFRTSFYLTLFLVSLSVSRRQFIYTPSLKAQYSSLAVPTAEFPELKAPRGPSRTDPPAAPRATW